jgi:hypothetical protein
MVAGELIVMKIQITAGPRPVHFHISEAAVRHKATAMPCKKSSATLCKMSFGIPKKSKPSGDVHQWKS